MITTGQKFEELVSIMARLRAPDGCPWDREQTFDTIKPYLLEEAYEVMDAIDARDWPHLADELGDLLLQVVFFAQMAHEAGHFQIADAIDAINQKLIRRHPHIFAEGDAKTPEDVKRRWDEIKVEEKKKAGKSVKGLLDNVPRSVPALVEAQQVTAKAATVGFDWENSAQVEAKLEEEVAELREAQASGDAAHIEEELGDALFAFVNLSRHLQLDAEQTLRKATRKFRARFAGIEAQAAAQGRSLKDMSIGEMEALWQKAKQSR